MEMIFVIAIISIIVSYFQMNKKDDNLKKAADRIVLYLKQTRYQALIDNKENKEDTLWHKKRWTFKFFRCSKNVGGIYYSIYSDENMTGHPNLEESLIDPLNKKRVYSTNSCEVSNNTSKYVLLTKEFDIVDVDISCNSTSSLGQISFGENGKVYSRLSNDINGKFDFEVENRCEIKLISKENKEISIYIEPKTAYIWANQ